MKTTNISAAAEEALDGFLDHLKSTRWLEIAKGLLFDAGPNATRFIMLGAGSVVGLCLLILTTVSARVYLRTGHIEGTMATLIATVVGIVAGFVGSALNFNKVDGSTPDQHHEGDHHGQV